MESRSGFIGSLVVHLGVIGGALAFAFIRPAPVEDVGAQDPILLEVWQGDGSERDPGIPGQARGVAEGMSSGDKSKTGLGGMPRIRSLDAGKLIKEMKEADRRAEAEAVAAEKAAQQAARDAEKKTATAKVDPTAPGNNKASPTKSSPKESLDAFLKSSGGKATAKNTSSAVGSGTGKSTGSSTTIKSARVGGEGTGTGSGKGSDGLGRPNGHDGNGGDGGRGKEDALFVGDVRGKFAEIFIPLFRDEGGDISLESDRGEVDVLVSVSGNVSFSGWFKRPNSDVVDRLVREAIRRMPPVRRPPGGAPITVRLPLKATVVD